MRQSRMCQFSIIQKTFLLLFLFFYQTGISAAFEGFYTIQAAKYTPASYSSAKKYFNTLYETLKDDEHNYLRIEQKDNNIVIRIGKFDDYAGAANLLEKIKPLARNASIVKAVDSEDMFVVDLYEKTSSPSDKDTPVSSKNEASPEVPARPEQVIEEYYTLQVKKFSKIEQASNAFNVLALKLKEDYLKDLRIEKIKGYFSVRLGKLKDYSSAKTLLARTKNVTPGAIIIKSKKANEQVISTYEKTSFPLIIVEKSGTSAEETGQSEKNQKPGSEKQNNEVVLLLKDVSSQYGKENYGKAAELLRKGIEKWPDNPDLYSWYGAALINMHYPETALQQYKKAVEISPDVPDYHAGVGISLVNIYMDRARESIDAFKKAIELDPNNVAGLEGLGFVYTSIGKKDLALEVYNRLKPLDKDAAFRLSQVITGEINWEAR
ncbi:MAG: tetratricopeptide repeat protein [Nitrospirae bacterium]|nr:MAG: tetratricopeptide repeat protein [Nitrospirota bacterium]